MYEYPGGLFDKITIHGRRNYENREKGSSISQAGDVTDGRNNEFYIAMPFTRMPLLEVPGEELVLVREGYSEGGENPNGWSAKTMPYLMEYDNWGGLVVDDRENIPREELAWRDWWGYDQIAWFAKRAHRRRIWRMQGRRANAA